MKYISKIFKHITNICKFNWFGLQWNDSYMNTVPLQHFVVVAIVVNMPDCKFSHNSEILEFILGLSVCLSVCHSMYILRFYDYPVFSNRNKNKL